MSAPVSPPPEIERQIRQEIGSYLARKKAGDNWLIGKEVIIRPPFAFDVTRKGGRFLVRIRGKSGSAEIACTKVVVSEYRPDIIFVDDSSAGVPALRRFVPLQGARRKLLNLVRPNSSLSARKFYEASKKGEGETQVNARRRWGELRTEYGFDTTYEKGANPFRRGAEAPVAEPNPRPDMGALDRDHWSSTYRAHDGLCNKCRRPVRETDGAEGDPGLLDHRRPVPFGGGDDRENLQLFCRVCNNLKNTVCQSCPIGYQCESCTWAYPEKFHDAVVLNLDPDAARKLAAISKERGTDPRDLAKTIFRKALDGLKGEK